MALLWLWTGAEVRRRWRAHAVMTLLVGVVVAVAFTTAAGARVIMSDLIWAQNRAISTQQKVYVIFSSQSYTIWYKDSTGVLQKCTNPLTQGTYTQTFGQKNSPLADVTIYGTPSFNGQSSLCYDEVGTPYGYDGVAETQMTSAGTVQVAAGEQRLTVSIEGYTGEASVQ